MAIDLGTANTLVYVKGRGIERFYRDVRAGPFMQPHSPIDAREYVGQVLLGTYPER